MALQMMLNAPATTLTMMILWIVKIRVHGSVNTLQNRPKSLKLWKCALQPRLNVLVKWCLNNWRLYVQSLLNPNENWTKYSRCRNFMILYLKKLNRYSMISMYGLWQMLNVMTILYLMVIHLPTLNCGWTNKRPNHRKHMFQFRTLNPIN
uniref:ACYPI006514 protein n=1 Tax=Acyrthosiphon pisum TaxID=7029 RepID=C4WT86_ACYPI|nr:ACYPI006514 [Acyrthosiphon pisum]